MMLPSRFNTRAGLAAAIRVCSSDVMLVKLFVGPSGGGGGSSVWNESTSPPRRPILSEVRCCKAAFVVDSLKRPWAVAKSMALLIFFRSQMRRLRLTKALRKLEILE